MIDAIDYILKFLAFASLTAVTMLAFDSVKELHPVFKSKKFLHYSILILWISGGLLIFIDGYISTRDKDVITDAQKRVIEEQAKTENEITIGENNLKESQAKTDKAQAAEEAALFKANTALESQIVEHRKDDYRIEKVHKTDSLNTVAQVNALKDSIHRSRNIPENPILDLIPNPTITKKDSLYWLNVTYLGKNNSIAKNIMQDKLQKELGEPIMARDINCPKLVKDDKRKLYEIIMGIELDNESSAYIDSVVFYDIVIAGNMVFDITRTKGRFSEGAVVTKRNSNFPSILLPYSTKGTRFIALEVFYKNSQGERHKPYYDLASVNCDKWILNVGVKNNERDMILSYIHRSE